MKFSEKIQKANEVLDWLEEYLDNEAFHKYTNLKLYDCAFCNKNDLNIPENIKEVLTDDILIDNFNTFCENNFRYLNNWCEDKFGNTFYECVKYMGGTSSFRMNNSNFNIEKSFCDTLDNIYDYFCSNWGNASSYLNEVNRFDMESIRMIMRGDMCADSEELINIIDYIINDLKEDVVKDTNNDLELQNHIKDFKENQLEYYSNFIIEEYESNPEFYPIKCKYCGELSEIGVDVDEDFCENCGHYYDGRDLETTLFDCNTGNEIVILGIEYDRLINDVIKETVYLCKDKTNNNEFYVTAETTMIKGV